MRNRASRHQQQLRQQQLRNHRKHRLLRRLSQRQHQMRQQYLSILRHLRGMAAEPPTPRQSTHVQSDD